MLRNKIFKVRRGALVATLVALVVAILVACPTANNGGGGPGGGSQYRYTCANGTGADATFDASAGGLIRCVSCNAGYASFNEVCLPSYVCVNGVASDESADSVGQSRCVSCSPIATLDGTADSIGTTCQFSVEVGEAARIGMAMQFGVSENAPYGLAAIGNTLYMVGLSNDVLYTLNIDPDDSTPDGRAMQVGSLSAGFGVGERSPTGLAAIDNTLYMVGFDNDVLYTLNIDSDDTIADGSADQVGSQSAGFGVGETTPTGLAAINDTLYMVGQTTNALYTLNIDPADGTANDGRAMQVGGLSAGFGVGERGGPTGLAAIGTTLYMIGERNDVLYTLNTGTGMATQVGMANQFDVIEGTATGLASIGTTLYMVGHDTDALYALRYQ